MEHFDHTDYIARYVCLYSTDYIFVKECFKTSNDYLAPIVYVGHGHDWSNPQYCVGHAVLENREDGMIAKCSFLHNDVGQTAKDLVMNTKEYGLSVYANGIEYEKLDRPVMTKKILHADVLAVLLVPTVGIPRVKEDSNISEE